MVVWAGPVANPTPTRLRTLSPTASGNQIAGLKVMARSFPSLRPFRSPRPPDGTTRRCLALRVQLLRGLATPRLRDDRLELSGGHGGEANQDGRESVVVRLGEELGRVQSQQKVLETLQLPFVANGERKVV